jgi:AmmeMemoRadiSam system protein B
MNRHAVVAGAFYPGNDAVLNEMLGRLVSKGDAKPVWALMMPHAGYIYSGGVAGKVAAAAEIPPQVVILCPNHSGMGTACSVWQDGEWEFPGFSVPVAADLAEEFLAGCPVAHADEMAHLREHSAEVLVPFLHYRQPKLSIVPICVSYLSRGDMEVIGTALAALVNKHPDVMIAISSDMSHYIPAARAQQLDNLALKPLLELDVDAFLDTVNEQQISMCGVIPAAIAATALKILDAGKGELVAYDNSGTQTGDKSEVVGYAGVIFPK